MLIPLIYYDIIHNMLLLLLFTIALAKVFNVPDDCNGVKCIGIHGKADIVTFKIPNDFRMITGTTAITDFNDLLCDYTITNDRQGLHYDKYILFVSTPETKMVMYEIGFYKITIIRISTYHDNKYAINNNNNTIYAISIPKFYSSKLIVEFDDYRMVVTHL